MHFMANIAIPSLWYSLHVTYYQCLLGWHFYVWYSLMYTSHKSASAIYMMLLFVLIVMPMFMVDVSGLVQDCSNSIANALELLQSCTKPSIYTMSMSSVMDQWWWARATYKWHDRLWHPVKNRFILPWTSHQTVDEEVFGQSNSISYHLHGFTTQIASL